MNKNRIGKVLAIALAALALAGIVSAQTAQSGTTREPALVRFNGGIGDDPVSGVANGVITLNVVRGVNPPGSIWRIADLEATVSTDGHIKVRGRGLLLAAGNSIATNANQSVHATLFCGSADAATSHSTNPAGVALAADGDFKIDDTLTPAPPSTCDTPVLLIENVGGVWFAAGIPATK